MLSISKNSENVNFNKEIALKFLTVFHLFELTIVNILVSCKVAQLRLFTNLTAWLNCAERNSFFAGECDPGSGTTHHLCPSPTVTLTI